MDKMLIYYSLSDDIFRDREHQPNCNTGDNATDEHTRHVRRSRLHSATTEGPDSPKLEEAH